MPFPKLSKVPQTVSLKEAGSSIVSPNSRTNAASSVMEEVEKTRSAAASPTFTSPNVLKDIRAYEHERQRVKKAADFVKMRSQKAQKGVGNGSEKSERHVDQKKGSGVPPSSVKGGKYQGREVERDDVDAQVTGYGNVSKRVQLGTTTNVEPPRYEVKLSDLVQAGKPRKSKGDNEFEVIPHIRSVIVLDDNTFDEYDLDEPWEHVNSVQHGEPKGLSYAQVAALSN